MPIKMNKRDAILRRSERETNRGNNAHILLTMLQQNCEITCGIVSAYTNIVGAENVPQMLKDLRASCLDAAEAIRLGQSL